MSAWIISRMFLVMVCFVFWLPHGAAMADGPMMTVEIATIPTPSEHVTHDPNRPRWQVELFTTAKEASDVRFAYVFAPYDHALRLFRTGRIDGVFNSTDKEERAVYDAYPMKDGRPVPALNNQVRA